MIFCKLDCKFPLACYKHFVGGVSLRDFFLRLVLSVIFAIFLLLLSVERLRLTFVSMF